MSFTPVLAAAGGHTELERVRRDTRLFAVLLGGAVAIALARAATRVQANPILAGVAGGLVVAAWNRYLLAWPTLLGAVLVVTSSSRFGATRSGRSAGQPRALPVRACGRAHGVGAARC